VKATVSPLKLLAGDVGVYLRRRDIGMAEHLLNGANIGVVLDQMRRKRMAKSVR
jgi:hypothetical protein